MKLIFSAFLYYLSFTLVGCLLSRKVSFSNLQNIIQANGTSSPTKNETNAENDQNSNGTTINENTIQKPAVNVGTLPPKPQTDTEAGPKSQKVPGNKSAISQALVAVSSSKKKEVKNDESSILPYYRLKHSKSMPVNWISTTDEEEIDPIKLKIAKKINVTADGNCLFRSFAVSLHGRDDGRAHKVLRKSAAQTLIKFESDTERDQADQEKMKNMIMANLPLGEEMSKYHDSIVEYATRYVAKNGAFVGIAECQALAIHLNRPVALINSRHNSVTVFHADFTQTEHGNITKDKYKQLWEVEDNPIVIWHDGGLHFNSVRLVSSALNRSMSQKFTQQFMPSCFSVDYADDSDNADQDDTDDDDVHANELFKTPPSPSLINYRQLAQRSFKLPSQYNPFRTRKSGGASGGIYNQGLSGYYDILNAELFSSASMHTPLIDFGKFEDVQQKSDDEKAHNAKRVNPFLKPDGSSYKEKDDE